MLEQHSSPQNRTPIGNLYITAIEARLYQNTEVLGKMDPYLVIEHSGKSQRTKCCNDAGFKPVWNHQFVFPLYSFDDLFKITCYDEDVVVDDFIAQRTFRAKELYPPHLGETAMQNWFPINYRVNRKGADLLLGLKFTRMLNQSQLLAKKTKKFTAFEGEYDESPVLNPQARSRNPNIARDFPTAPVLGGHESGAIKKRPDYYRQLIKEEEEQNALFAAVAQSPTGQSSYQGSHNKNIMHKKLADRLMPRIIEESRVQGINFPSESDNTQLSVCSTIPSQKFSTSSLEQSTGGSFQNQSIKHRPPIKYESSKVLPRFLQQDLKSTQEILEQGELDSTPNEGGLLSLLIERAELFRNTEILGKMDPYIKVDCHSKIYKTKVIDNGGKTPVWNQQLTVNVKVVEGTFTVSCLDEDLFSDDLVGAALVPLKTVCTRAISRQQIELIYKNKLAGILYITTKFTPTATNNSRPVYKNAAEFMQGRNNPEPPQRKRPSIKKPKYSDQLISTYQGLGPTGGASHTQNTTPTYKGEVYQSINNFESTLPRMKEEYTHPVQNMQGSPLNVKNNSNNQYASFVDPSLHSSVLLAQTASKGTANYGSIIGQRMLKENANFGSMKNIFPTEGRNRFPDISSETQYGSSDAAIQQRGSSLSGINQHQAPRRSKFLPSALAQSGKNNILDLQQSQSSLTGVSQSKLGLPSILHFGSNASSNVAGFPALQAASKPQIGEQYTSMKPSPERVYPRLESN